MMKHLILDRILKSWRLGICLLFAMLLAGLILWCIWGEVQVYQLKHAHQRVEIAKYSSEDAEQYWQICSNKAGSTFFGIFQCTVSEVDSNRQAQRAKYDLKAQQDMAEWAFATMLLTGFGAVISIFGLAGLFISLSQTRTAIRDTREIGEKQTVAYLCCDSVEFGLGERKGDPYRPEITSLWRNAGATPAFSFGGRHHLIVKADSRVVIDCKLETNIERGLISIDPGSVKTLHAAPDDLSFSDYIEQMKTEKLVIDLHIVGSFRNAFKHIEPVNAYFRSSAIHHYDNTFDHGGAHNFEIKLAQYEPENH
jgi:hypothetical protein